MACGCKGSSCGCAIEAGRGVSVTGSGSAGRPFIINADPVVLQVSDTATVELTLTGDGTSSNPLQLEAEFVGPTDPTWQDSVVQTSWSGDVDLSGLTQPTTIRATIVGDVTSLTLPTWDSDKAGIIHLVLAQDGTGGHAWTVDETFAGGNPIALSSDPGARDYVACHWTGQQWIVLPLAMDVMAIPGS